MRKKIAEPVATFREAAASLQEEHKAAWKNGKHEDQWIDALTTYAFPELGDRFEDRGDALADAPSGLRPRRLRTRNLE